MDSRRILAFLKKYKILLSSTLLVIIGATSYMVYVLIHQKPSQDLGFSNATILSGQNMDSPSLYTTIAPDTNVNTTLEDSCGAISPADFSEALLAVKKLKSNIEEINLHDKNISCVPIDTFKDLEDLHVLDMRGNPLNIKRDQPWIRHPALRVLDISDCNLGPLPPIVFKYLPRLKRVNMAGNPGCIETQKQILNIKIDCGPVFK